MLQRQNWSTGTGTCLRPKTSSCPSLQHRSSLEFTYLQVLYPVCGLHSIHDISLYVFLLPPLLVSPLVFILPDGFVGWAKMVARDGWKCVFILSNSSWNLTESLQISSWRLAMSREISWWSRYEASIFSQHTNLTFARRINTRICYPACFLTRTVFYSSALHSNNGPH